MRRMLCLLLSLLAVSMPAYAAEDAWQIVGCNEYVSLRAEPRPDAQKVGELPLGSQVLYLEHAPGGYAHVKGSDAEGYVLAMYLVPADSDAVLEPPERTIFTAEEARVGGVRIGETTQSEIQERFGEPDTIDETTYDANGETHITWTYADVAFTFTAFGDDESLPLTRIQVWAEDATGPRGLRVGLDIGQALASFPIASPMMLDGRDFMLYSQAENDLMPPFGVLQRSDDLSLPDYTVWFCAGIPGEHQETWMYDRMVHLFVHLEDNRVASFEVYAGVTAE